ncbi:uncharacterized protein LOC141667038 [Apium graveolens]|uniref:uncharacterized protein LOC141667038 n=1 Tax=Apium graveolens TaxID=4045 RepID=UPI003D7A015C
MNSSGSTMKWGRKKIRSGQKPKISKHKRMRRRMCDTTSSYGDYKDVCICIRLEFEDHEDGPDHAKWLRVKIPAILLHKRGRLEYASPTSPLDIPNLVDYSDTDEEDDGCGEFMLPNQNKFCCLLDPINGPFDFPSLRNNFIYTPWIRCSPVGSVMYALGADPAEVVSYKDILSQASGQVCPPNPYVTTEAVTGGRASVKPPFRNPSFTTSNHASHRLHFCDFSKPKPKWEISPAPLISPRIWPKLVSMNGKIYAFGGNLLTDDQSPYAEVFDPDLGYWSPLPNPPFGKLADYELLVFPLHESSSILLIGYVSHVVYTFSTSSWYWSPFRACTRLCQLLHFRGWITYLHPVISDDTLYWIDQLGRLCAYILKGNGSYYVGPISVFKGEEEHSFINKVLKDRDSYPLALLPISPNLLGLLWCDIHFVACLRSASTLHITILHVSLHKEIDLEHTDSNSDIGTDKNPVLSLTASAVACLCFPLLREVTSVMGAYLIDDDKESWQLMSSCSSYRTVDTHARY